VFGTAEHVGRHHWRPHTAQPCYAAMFDTLLLPHNKLQHSKALDTTVPQTKNFVFVTVEHVGRHHWRPHTAQPCYAAMFDTLLLPHNKLQHSKALDTTVPQTKILCLSLWSTLEDTTGDHTRRNHATRQCLTRSCCRTTSYIIPNLSKTQFSNQKFCVWHCGARWKTPLATTHGATMLRGNV
jgi:uncharacterized protein YceK